MFRSRSSVPDNIIHIDDGGYLRIQNAANRINSTIYLVGSRASGTYKDGSDFDYIIPGIRRKAWRKIRNSLPGSKSQRNNFVNCVELLKADLDTLRPFIKVTPEEKEDDDR